MDAKKIKGKESTKHSVVTYKGIPGGSDGEVSACRAGDPGLIPGLGRSPGKGYGNPPFLYSRSLLINLLYMY